MEIFLCYLKSQRVNCYKEETEHLRKQSGFLVAFLPLTFFSKGGWPLRTCLQNNSELPMHAHSIFLTCSLAFINYFVVVSSIDSPDDINTEALALE